MAGFEHHPLVAIAGPTGSGKSELSLAIAREFGGEIVNYDSVQMYRSFDIGSAKVPLPERRGIVHHLIDVVDPCSEMTAGQFAREASQVLADVTARKKLPVLAGGTGFYLRALLDGLSPAPVKDAGLRERLVDLAERRPGALSRFLRRFDPPAAARIHGNDRQKLIRAVEIVLLAREPVSQVQARKRIGLRGYSVLKIGLLPDRPLLHERLNQRTDWMFRHGLLEETRALLEGGVPMSARPMLSLGYKQAVAVLCGTLTLAAAISECQTRTRQYAKRQITWFRADHDVRWFAGFGSECRVQEEVLEAIRGWLR
ncbi:MAG TPA: tRNA (adenosine(37)-N6)-dimethylallyltransferase MiaA [Bryobacteraceae bacterium]|jgi:tRNA dimethylallyltransferase|nr:tRNA (adenosine(37)-N6)-dimethylallyltransferase MiaA [Bryobacteraceae bacterium]